MCYAIVVECYTTPAMQNAILVGLDAIKTASVMAKVLAPFEEFIVKAFW